MNGLLIVDKPAGLTSHDVVNRVRRLARLRRVGHAGTLDPMATGVLVLLLGPATRLSRFAMAGHKHYRGVLRLGETTDTYDAEGRITARRPVHVDLPEIEQALVHFRGDLLQIPPMVAAIKVQGSKLYELARRGEEVEREPRPVTIDSIEILDWQSPDLTLDVHCSPGTYIRSLAYDLGEALGCGAHLRCLRRVASGAFTLDDSRPLDALEEPDSLRAALLPPQAALGTMPVVLLSPEQERAVRYGQTLNLSPSEAERDPHLTHDSLVQAHDCLVQAHDLHGHLIGVLQRQTDDDQSTLYRPIIVLPPESG